MRDAPWLHLEKYRLPPPHGGARGEDYGAFKIPHPPTGVTLLVIASNDFGWQHVSVSLPNWTPNWREMEFVCRQFWTEDDAVMQLHPPRRDWISNHPTCLHLWKATETDIPLPPKWMVGAQDVGELDPARATDRAKALEIQKRAAIEMQREEVE